jgi:hypothetical protein
MVQSSLGKLVLSGTFFIAQHLLEALRGEGLFSVSVSVGRHVRSSPENWSDAAALD